MKFSCLKLQRWKENVVYVNDGRVIAVVRILKSNLTMEETLINKGMLEKLTRKGKSFLFYTTANKLKP